MITFADRVEGLALGSCGRNVRTWIRGRPAAAVVLATLLGGCGGDSQLGQVTGRVTVDGQPLAGAAVEFNPVGRGSSSYAQTDQAGRYQLYQGPRTAGALPGQYRVSISKTEPSGTPDGDRETLPAAITSRPR